MLSGTERLILADPAALPCDDQDCARCAAALQQRLVLLDQNDRA